MYGTILPASGYEYVLHELVERTDEDPWSGERERIPIGISRDCIPTTLSVLCHFPTLERVVVSAER